MLDKQKVVHDLALVYAQEKYREYLMSTPKEKRPYPSEVSQLAKFYETGAACLANQTVEILNAYLDDEGNPIIPD
jgi:hypothetical protein